MLHPLGLVLLLLVRVASPAYAQNAPAKPSPHADALEDGAGWVAKGAPMLLLPKSQIPIVEQPRHKAGETPYSPLPMLSFAPLPPLRSEKLGTGKPPSPEAEAIDEAEAPSAEPSMPEQANPPASGSFFDVFRRLSTLESPPPPIEPVTPDELEEEEAKTPEPTLIEKQTDAVNITCLDPKLMQMIHETGKHFGGLPVITSGQRDKGRKGSYHRQCKAADFFIPDIPRATLAKYLRALPEAGGVGTYCHTKSVHLDIGEPRNWSQCGFRFRFAQRG